MSDQKTISASTGKTLGQIAYEEDVRRRPKYGNGKPRKAWHELNALCQNTWEAEPTPRDFSSLPSSEGEGK